MDLNRSLTASVYIAYQNKVLLHRHKKYNILFPVGGHMEPNEVPHETAIREVFEESGLKIKFYNDEENFKLGHVKQLIKPIHILLENIGQEVENIDFIYFAVAETDRVKPSIGESREFYWLSKEKIKQNIEIKPHVRQMALDALKKIYV